MIVTLSVFGIHVHVLYGFRLDIRGTGKPIMLKPYFIACQASGVRVCVLFTAYMWGRRTLLLEPYAIKHLKL